MTGSEESKLPSRRALKCPNGHTRWEVREESFYCEGCPENGYATDGRFESLWNQRTGTYIDHEEFLRRWGTDPYE
ncbi:hypothetical protein BRC81_13525 [Halobacteriales archaeon QS_1_68_20]|nr:MAG: hypothetical protein BRC81_13525 [Halobacteriales archaeon QS_1_68_20]